MANTPRLSIPEITEGQYKKYLTHNTALMAIDALLQASVKDRDLSSPPGSPTHGNCYLVKTPGAGAWLNKDNQIAQYYNGAWYFYAPSRGWTVWVEDESIPLFYDSANWVTNTNVATFVGLTDTPNSYTGNGSKVVQVTAAENGLEFANVAAAAHTHPIADITDLQNELNAKSPTTHDHNTDYVAISTLTAKGDILTRNMSSPTSLAVGTNGYVLSADDTEATGLKWIAGGGGGGGGTPAGANREIQYNDNGVFGASAELSYGLTGGTYKLKIGPTDDTYDVEIMRPQMTNNLVVPGRFFIKGQQGINGGDVWLTGGAATGLAVDGYGEGGAIEVSGANGTKRGGNINLNAGSSELYGGGVNIEAGSVYADTEFANPGDVNIRAGGANWGSVNGMPGGDVFIRSGYGYLSKGGDITLECGSGEAGGDGGNIQFKAGTTDGGTAGTITFTVGGSIRPLQIDNSGAFLLDDGQFIRNYIPGDYGQQLTSYGSGSPPIWSWPILPLTVLTEGRTTVAADSTILCDATTASFTVVLAPRYGQVLTVKKIDSSANTITIDPGSGNTIDGATTKTISVQWDKITMHCDGANWFII